MPQLALSLTTPFATCWVSESLYVSGVLGIVACGLYRSRWGHRASPVLAHLNICTVWGAIVFVTLVGQGLTLQALIQLWQKGESADDVLPRLKGEIDLAEAQLTRDG